MLLPGSPLSSGIDGCLKTMRRNEHMHVNAATTSFPGDTFFTLGASGRPMTRGVRDLPKVFLAPPLLFIVVFLTPSPQSLSAATTLVPLYTFVRSHSLNSSTRFSGSNISNPHSQTLITFHRNSRHLHWHREVVLVPFCQTPGTDLPWW